HHVPRTLAARYEHGRAAAALERAPRRHVARRSPAAPSGVSRSVHAGAGAPPCGAPRADGSRPGERKERALLGPEVRARRLVRRPREPRARPPHPLSDVALRRRQARRRGPGTRDHAGVPMTHTAIAGSPITHLVIGAAGHAQEVAWSLREMLGRQVELLFFD